MVCGVWCVQLLLRLGLPVCCNAAGVNKQAAKFILELTAEPAVIGIPVLRVSVLRGDERLRLAMVQQVTNKLAGVQGAMDLRKAMQLACAQEPPAGNAR